jgi:hypothetical protein
MNKLTYEENLKEIDKAFYLYKDFLLFLDSLEFKPVKYVICKKSLILDAKEKLINWLTLHGFTIIDGKYRLQFKTNTSVEIYVKVDCKPNKFCQWCKGEGFTISYGFYKPLTYFEPIGD